MAVIRTDGVASLIRLIAALTALASLGFALTGCGPSYSPDTYATNAAQQANKVDAGVIVGVRPVAISAAGTVGGLAGAAAGGVAGSQVGPSATSAFTAIGGSVIGGIAGVTAEHVVGDTNGFEYIVRKSTGEMVSVVQKEEKALPVGQKVLVISGNQARIVADYTVPFDTPPKVPASAASSPASAAGSQPKAASVQPPDPPLIVPSPPSGTSTPSAGTVVPPEGIAPSAKAAIPP
jgi:outer membrane lipoprotein SlyB